MKVKNTAGAYGRLQRDGAAGARPHAHQRQTRVPDRKASLSTGFIDHVGMGAPDLEAAKDTATR